MDLTSLILHGERIKKILDQKFRGMQISSYKKQDSDVLLVVNWISQKDINIISQFLTGELHIVSNTLSSNVTINLNQNMPVFIPVYRYHKKISNSDISNLLVLSIVEELMIGDMKVGLPVNLSQKDVVDALKSILTVIESPVSFSHVKNENKRKIIGLRDEIFRDLK